MELQTVDDLKKYLYTWDSHSYHTEDYVFGLELEGVLTDSEGNPTGWKGIGIDPNDFSEKTLHRVRSMVEAMGDEVDPIPLKYGDVVMNYLYYGDSKSIRQLRWLPFVEIVVVGLFILIGFWGFNSIRRSEQQFIWVGMAKETAHQLGTPISSLMGWIELLKMKDPGPEQLAILKDAEQDIERLNKVAHRFSQIGSKSGIKSSYLDDLVQDVVHYFRRRLPQMGKQVELVYESTLKDPLTINPELFEWVLENLIKNSLDAIGRKKGKIIIRAEPYAGKKYRAVIDVIDNGRGIEPRERKNVFRPGYSTKKHGWGLGLSLASRIIESYHGGKLLLHASHAGKGTTMRILI